MEVKQEQLKRVRSGETANAWFVGFAPYDKPEIAVVSIIENGGDSAIATRPVKDILAKYFGIEEGTKEETGQNAIPNVENQN